jgi:hypothetical protein
MGLRDFASHCLRRVAPALSSKHSSDESTTKFIVDTTLLTLIRNAIRKGGGENVYSEAVLLLGEMVTVFVFSIQFVLQYTIFILFLNAHLFLCV